MSRSDEFALAALHAASPIGGFETLFEHGVAKSLTSNNRLGKTAAASSHH